MHNAHSCERGERKKECPHMHFFNTVKKKRMQVGWVALQSALPSRFNQIRGEENHKVMERSNKTKKS
jgi:hypothetical protein